MGNTLYTNSLLIHVIVFFFVIAHSLSRITATDCTEHVNKDGIEHNDTVIAAHFSERTRTINCKFAEDIR